MINIGDPVNIVPTSLRSSDFYKGTVIGIKEHLYNVKSESGRDAWYTKDELKLDHNPLSNGIDHKDVPKHRLINAKKIAVNSSVHDYRKAEKPQLPKQDDNMWKSIKKFAVKRLLPDIKEIIDGDLYANIDDSVLTYGGFVEIFGEIVWEVEYTREL